MLRGSLGRKRETERFNGETNGKNRDCTIVCVRGTGKIKGIEAVRLCVCARGTRKKSFLLIGSEPLIERYPVNT